MIADSMLTPTGQPEDPHGRFMLNAYGRRCWDLGFQAARVDPSLLAQWQPIETAPKDGTMIIGALIVGSKIWRVHEMKHNGLAFYTAAGGSLPRMTHWIPMPALRAALLVPTVKQADGG